MVIGKRDPNALYCDDVSLTKQSFKDEVDINQIVARAQAAGGLPVAERVAQYGDFSNVPSYQEALNLVNRANGMFMSLDAAIRERFGNDAGSMVRFLQNPANYEEAVRLGIVKPKEPPKAITPLESNQMPLVSEAGLDSGVSTETPATGEARVRRGGSK